jgi:hypothetical protein
LPPLAGLGPKNYLGLPEPKTITVWKFFGKITVCERKIHSKLA